MYEIYACLRVCLYLHVLICVAEVLQKPEVECYKPHSLFTTYLLCLYWRVILQVGCKYHVTIILLIISYYLYIYFKKSAGECYSICTLKFEMHLWKYKTMPFQLAYIPDWCMNKNFYELMCNWILVFRPATFHMF